MPKIPSSDLASFLNTGTVESPVWSLIGEGVSASNIELNPDVESEVYIHEDTASPSLESYAPTMPIEQIANNGDAVFEFLDNLRKTRAVLDDVATEVCIVRKYDTTVDGFYKAKKQDVVIAIDKADRQGGKSLKIGYTINFNGDPTNGAFNPTPTAEFEAGPVLAGLSALDMDSVVLAPAFDEERLLYVGTTTSATDTLTATASDETATVAIDVDGVTVVSGADATWSEGLNIVTVEVTVDTEVVNYRIGVTYTPAA